MSLILISEGNREARVCRSLLDAHHAGAIDLAIPAHQAAAHRHLSRAAWSSGTRSCRPSCSSHPICLLVGTGKFELKPW
jgi:hypothetical protein